MISFQSTAYANSESASKVLPEFVPQDWLLVTATVLFAIAVVHTFVAKKILELSHHFPKDSMRRNVLHFLGEVEVVFGFWAFVLIGVIAAGSGTSQAVSYLRQVNFTEAVFVFVIMCMAATKPIIQVARDGITLFAKLLPIGERQAFFISALVLGPLLGSFITEPAAMTVVALLLRDKFYRSAMSKQFRYATLGLLFVNVSIGGTLTTFAAPPVLMVAGPWGLTTASMLADYGWKAAVAILINTIGAAIYFRKELGDTASKAENNHASAGKVTRVSNLIVATHVFFMAVCVLYHTHIYFFLPLFLLFLGWVEVSAKHQEQLKMREALLVGFFLGGLVVLGGLQGWWLKPILSSLSEIQMFIGATALTAVTDNAALTYLGTLVPGLSDASKYFLLGGAVCGGGLTVIANAPNPAGYGILQSSFGQDGISPGSLFLAALPFTFMAMAMFYFF
jgi:hypothetical protein